MVWPDNLTALVSEYLPFGIDWLPKGTCLVGGAVRDALLNRQRDYLDLDLVLPSFAVETARKIANAFQVGFVVLDDRRQIARLVFEQGTVDFALQEGVDLEADLRRRDFTVNAIAYDLQQAVLFDPVGGRVDLDRRCLRMVSLKNLSDDPLRLLRAYRQAAQLDFNLDGATQSALRQLAPLIGTMAAERVQTELNYLLSHRRGLGWLKIAWEDGLIKPWLPRVTAEKLGFTLQIDPIALKLEQETAYHFIPHYQRLGKLTCLVAQNSQKAEQELVRLKYSRAEIRTVMTVLRSLPIFHQAALPLALKDQYLLFLEVGKVFPVFALVAIAMGCDRLTIISLLHRFLDPSDPVAHPRALVTGKDLIEQLQIKPSPLVGKLLTALQIAQVEGKIQTPDQAIIYARTLLPKC
jgi:tRNA nucleotidyltransferase (CCA-adding enzyme)